MTTVAMAAAPDPDNECDAIAALHLPYSSTTAVHEVQEADWIRGVAACEAEVRAYPGEIRFVYELGRAQDHINNYMEALRDYKTVAAAGYTEAMVDLGAMYYLGHGVVQSYPTAFDNFTKAAAVGSVRALANLASMYGDGRGVPRDDAKSLDLAEKAVEQGNPFGLKLIADHYFNGADVPRDYHMAAQYLQQATDLGNGQSMKFLASMYESGYLGPPDPAKAGELRLRAQKVDLGSRDPIPAHLPMLRQASSERARPMAPHRRARRFLGADTFSTGTIRFGRRRPEIRGAAPTTCSCARSDATSADIDGEDEHLPATSSGRIRRSALATLGAGSIRSPPTGPFRRSLPSSAIGGGSGWDTITTTKPWAISPAARSGTSSRASA